MPKCKLQHFAGIPSVHGSFLFSWLALTERTGKVPLRFLPSYLLPMEQQGNRWAVIKCIVDSTSDCSIVNVLLLLFTYPFQAGFENLPRPVRWVSVGWPCLAHGRHSVIQKGFRSEGRKTKTGREPRKRWANIVDENKASLLAQNWKMRSMDREGILKAKALNGP